MKTKNLLSVLAIMALCFNVASCSKPIEETPEEMEQAPKKAVSITTRSTSTIEYPITLYAFNTSGTLVESITAEDAEDDLEMRLAVGQYHLVAMAGMSGLNEVTTPMLDASIGIPDNGIIASAVQMGQADINMASTELEADIEITITLTYQVAQVYVELHDIPTDVISASITLSSLYADETFHGTKSGSKAVTIPLNRKSETENTTWCSNIVYTLPGCENIPLTLNINLSNNEKSKIYSYSHNTNLQEATPYNLIGSFKNGFNLTGTITAEGWNEPENITFTFGMESGEDTPEQTPEDTPENEPNDKPDNGPISVSEIPEAKTLWNGHFVAKVTNNGDGNAELLLMSLEEWDIAGVDASTEPISHAESYVENDMSNWCIPTSQELIAIFPTFATSSAIENVNKTLVNEGKGTKLTNASSYLCDEATKYVLLSANPIAINIIDSQNYHLRLVKTVTVVKSE